MPYNTNDFQLTLDTLSNKEEFQMTEIVGCEPFEYSDVYTPTKYGIIFKEKIIIGPTDNTCATVNVRLMKGEQELDQIEGMKPKYFKVEILDNNKVIYAQNGYN